MRKLTAAMGASIEGLHSASFGRAIDDQGMSFVAMTEWESLEAIQAVYGEGWAEQSILPGAEEYIVETTVEHFEATLEDISDQVERRRIERQTGAAKDQPAA